MRLPWPKRGDKLFAESDAGRSVHMGSIMWNYPQHANAFKRAGDLAVEAYQNDASRWHYDELIFPVLYLYRHALELKLKEIVGFGVVLRLFARKDVEQLLTGSHRLAQLWTKAKAVIDYRWPGGDDEPVKAVEVFINELHQVDPNGQTLRYGKDQEGRPHSYEQLPDWINLENLCETVDGVFNFLDACRDGIDDGIADMRAGM